MNVYQVQRYEHPTGFCYDHTVVVARCPSDALEMTRALLGWEEKNFELKVVEIDLTIPDIIGYELNHIK